MKAYLIDPFEKQVTEVDYTGVYTNIYDHIKAKCFTAVGINPKGDSIFVDDEGLYVEDQKYFLWKGYGQPLAGRGLVLGTDDEGESISPSVTLEWVQDRVIFPERDIVFTGITTTEGEVDDPLFGKMFKISNTPHFAVREDKDEE